MATIVSCKDWTRHFLLMILTVIVAGCGGGRNGGSSTPPTSILSGVAAVGTPIANGTINVICATGSALTPTTTSSTGAWQATLSGQTLPCAVEMTGGTINGATNTTSYHSIAVTAGTVNVTPLTDLMVANMVATATPRIWFAGLNSNPTSLTTITQAQVTTALTKLSTALSGLTPLNTDNPITTSFDPTSGNVSDNMLTALATTMANTGITHADLLNDASFSGFATPSPGFSVALASAYTSLASNGVTSSQCFGNLALLTAGNTYQINQEAFYNRSVVSTDNEQYTVNGPTTFNGNSAVETQLDIIATSGSMAGSTFATIKNYEQQTATQIINYGSVSSDSAGTMTTTYTPPIALPVDLPLNQEYTINTIATESGATSGQQQQSYTWTFLGIETVTVPAGTYSACKFKTGFQNGVTPPGSGFDWIVAGGIYSGLLIKTADANGNTIVDATKLLFNGQ